MSLNFYRRITQLSFILLIFLLPVLDIFRYDTATRELIFFGRVWSLGLKQGFYADHGAMAGLHVALQFFLKAILPWLLFLAIFPLLGFLTGRFFCGWLCPEGAVFELTDFFTLKILGRRSLYAKKPNDPELPVRHKSLYVLMALLTVLTLPPAAGVALTGYLIAPKTVFEQIMSWQFTFGVKAGIIGVSIYMLVTWILVRHVFCKYICAAGLMQMLFGWISPIALRIRLDVPRFSECTDCKGCDKACFMNVTPRKLKRDISCVNCGACVDACNRELGPGKGLFRLKFGKSAESERNS